MAIDQTYFKQPAESLDQYNARIKAYNVSKGGLPSLPQGGGSAPLPGETPSLPDTGTPTSPLLSFANSLDATVNLARKSRNALSLDMMKPFQGTVAASDFSQILSNLNNASDKTSENLIKNANDIANPPASNIITATNDAGDVTALDKTTGKVLWTAKGVGNKEKGPAPTKPMVTSGGLLYTADDYSEDASALETSRGQDGWTDPAIYKQLYDAWVAKGGKIADFVKTYPPEQYVNPANTTLPPYLKPKKSGVVNPFAN